ncbi:MAG TPA: YciI family protein [Terrimesophilobacter sp.]|nr:YciI family protein [Terrimesophilobacter sp.]
MTVIDDGQAADAGRVDSATQSEAAAIDEFNERLERDGHWVMAAGLSAPSDATVVDSRGESPVLSHGPFAEGSSYAAGFWVVEAPDEAEALLLAGDASRACNRRVELRGLL